VGLPAARVGKGDGFLVLKVDSLFGTWRRRGEVKDDDRVHLNTIPPFDTYQSHLKSPPTSMTMDHQDAWRNFVGNVIAGGQAVSAISVVGRYQRQYG